MDGLLDVCDFIFVVGDLMYGYMLHFVALLAVLNHWTHMCVSLFTFFDGKDIHTSAILWLP